MCWLGAFPSGWSAAPLINLKGCAEQDRQSDSDAFAGPRIADQPLTPYATNHSRKGGNFRRFGGWHLPSQI